MVRFRTGVYCKLRLKRFSSGYLNTTRRRCTHMCSPEQFRNVLPRQSSFSKTLPADAAASVLAHTNTPHACAPKTNTPQLGERLKGVVVTELEGTSGKKAWVSLGVMRRAKGGRFSPVDGMIRLSKEKGLKPKKVAVDRPVTVYVSKVCSRSAENTGPDPKSVGRKIHRRVLSPRPRSYCTSSRI